jgi:hypothetical protein
VSIFVAIVFSVKSIMVNISTREMLLDLFKDKSELISDSWNKMMHLIQEGILSIDQQNSTAKPILNYINTEMINLLNLSDLSRMDLIEAELRKFKFYDSDDLSGPMQGGINKDEDRPERLEKKELRS